MNKPKDGNKLFESQNKVTRSSLGDVTPARVGLIPSVDGQDKEGIVVFSRKAKYVKPSFL